MILVSALVRALMPAEDWIQPCAPLSLLQCEDEEEAAKLANDLKALNDSRKALTEQGTEAAYKLINGSDLKNDRVMVVFFAGLS